MSREISSAPVYLNPPDPTLHGQFLASQDATRLHHWATENLAWQAESVRLYGKERTVPRQIAWAADAGTNYRYSATDHVGSGWPEVLETLRQQIAEHTEMLCNHMLANRYRNGDEYMGWHRDDERRVASDVYVISLGAARTLRWRRADRGISQALELTHGSLLQMNGRLYHTLTRSRKVSDERISLTFRRVLV